MPSRVLLVEDDPVIQEYCRETLAAGGLTVEACATAKEARALFAAAAPDLVVLDIGLPDGTGLDLLREWGARGARVPVLFLTARGDLRTRLDCFRGGARDYVQKPFAAQELLARALVHLDAKRSLDGALLRNVELELAARARQDMTDMIVHDLKTPLAAIKGTLELVRSRGMISAGQHAELLEHAGTAAEFMLLMLNDILDVSLDGQSGLRAELSPVEVAPLHGKLEALFAGRARKTKVSVSWSCAPEARVVTGDQRLLFRVLANLVANAMAASPPGAEVEVRCARRGRAARLSVCDRGPGVPDAEKESVFRKFSTGARPSLEAGSGIGLAFCRAAARAMGGRVWVEDRDGGGSCFHLEIPQAG